MSRDLVHAVDWFPTLLSLAGDTKASTKASAKARGVEGDGVDMAGMVTRAEPGPRTELVYNINDALRCEAGLGVANSGHSRHALDTVLLTPLCMSQTPTHKNIFVCCLRSIPVDPYVVCLSVRNVENDDDMMT